MTGSQKLSFWALVIGLPAWAMLWYLTNWKIAAVIYVLTLANNLQLQASRIR